MRGSTITVALVALLLTGCSNNPTTADRLEAVTAERDALQAQIDAVAERHDKSAATQHAVIEIIADPASFGTDEEVLDLLDRYAASPDVPYVDDALGVTTYRRGWHDTLFNEVGGDIVTWHRWLSDDGSNGGSLWSWNGTAGNGEPFSLDGIVLEEFDDDGLYSRLTVYWPMTDEEVARAFDEGN